MPIYIYQARDEKGKSKKGEMFSSSEQALAQALEKQGLLLTFYKIKKKRFSLKTLFLSLGSVSELDKILFTRNLAVMLKAGLSISRALDILYQQTKNKRLKRVISDVRENVVKGKSLNYSLSRFPKIFPSFYISTIKVGETGGTLDEMLKRLADQLKKSYDLGRKIKGAMTYPIVVLVAMAGVMILMLAYVLPKLTLVFGDLDVELPLMTRMIIALSDFVVRRGLVVACGIALAVILITLLIRTKKGRHGWHNFLIQFPLIGRIIKETNLANFARISSSLIKSGLSIDEVFNITSDTLGNVLYKEVLHKASLRVKKGGSISLPFRISRKLFPSLVSQMITVGEETGKLDEILTTIADFYEESVSRSTENLASVIEPILTIVLGIGVGIIAVSIIQPMYSLMGQM